MYHSTRISTPFMLSWKELVTATTGTTDNIELLCQHKTDIIFKNLLSPSLTTSQSNSALPPQLVDINYLEENALRYISGYIISKLKKQVSKSKHTLKKYILIGLDDFIEERSEGPSSNWTTLVDRGGLCKATEDAYTIFYEVEVVMRRFLRIEELTSMDSNFKEIVLRNMESDEDVWSKLTSEVDKAASIYSAASLTYILLLVVIALPSQ